MVLIPDSFGQFSSLKKGLFFQKAIGHWQKLVLTLQEALQNPKGGEIQ